MDLSSRTDLPAAFDERGTLTQLLSYVRLTVHAKCVGLSESDAVHPPLESSPAMSIAGLVSHLRWSEAFWIDVVFLGRPNQWPGTDDDSELQMRRGLEQPLAELLDEYAQQAAHTDDVIAAHDWDAEAVGRDSTGKPFALRYIITHLIAGTLGAATSTSSATARCPGDVQPAPPRGFEVSGSVGEVDSYAQSRACGRCRRCRRCEFIAGVGGRSRRRRRSRYRGGRAEFCRRYRGGQ
jgi:hypothetical protein